MSTNKLFSLYAPDGLSWQGAITSPVLCTQCGAEFSTVLNNKAHNALTCDRCRNHLHQFVNASANTIRPNTAIAGAHIDDVGTSLPELGWMRLFNRLDVINSRHEPVIQVCRIGEPHQTPFFEHRTPLITPDHNLSSWQMDCQVPVDFFPRRECRVAIELSVTTIWGDLLARHLNALNTFDLFRRVVQTEIKFLSDEQPALMREFRHLETHSDHRDARYAAVLCHLTDYVLTRSPS